MRWEERIDDGREKYISLLEMTQERDGSQELGISGRIIIQ
jgi:hypothetical protein